MQNQTDGPARQAAAGLRGEARKQLEGAGQAYEEVGYDLSRKAGELAGEAKEALGEQADAAKRGVGDHLEAFGGALNAAREHLESNGQSVASKFVGEASEGLSRLATSLHEKPLGEFLDELRDAGRKNGGGVFAGAVLTGLALGRLLRVSEGGHSSSPDDEKGMQSWTASNGDSQQSSSDAVPDPSEPSGYPI